MYGVIFYLTNITTKMKRITAGGIILGTIFLAACTHARQNGSYYVSGIVTNPQMEGRTIYLQDAIHSTTRYDSTQVIDCRFAFEGKINSPQVRELFIQENDSDRFPVTLPIVVEAGKISTQIGDVVQVEGTALNTEMMQFLLAIDQFREHDFSGKSVHEIKESFTGLLMEQIIKHVSSPIGKYIYAAYGNKLSTGQRAIAKKNLGIN